MVPLVTVTSSINKICRMDSHQTENTQNYITVIPIEYPRSRVYPQTQEYVVDQYSDYLRDRSRDEYVRGDYNINSEPKFDEVGPLYTVSQRFEREKPPPPALAHVGAASYRHDVEREWERSLHPHPHPHPHLPSSAADRQQDCAAGKCSDVSGDDQLVSQVSPPRFLNTCIYLMSKVVLNMEIEDGHSATVHELVQYVMQEEELALPRVASNIFTLWMCSGLLEIQLKLFHKPFDVRKRWQSLVSQYTNATDSQIDRDEPILSFQRNVFFSKRDEEKIKDQKLLDLLYDEAKYNILEGRYPCEISHYIMLGGIQARIELGPYVPQVHTTQFFREHQRKFLPTHVSRSNWSWLRISGKNSPEVRLLEQFKRIPSNTPVRKLIRKYLEFCWSLPYYGGAFFRGQVEQPVRGLTSLITHQDVSVLVAINTQGVYIIDDIQCTLLLGLKYEEMSWDFAKPSQEDNPDCLPCLFLQFMVLENGTRVSKILQVFSKQAVMMDALISVFVDEIKQKTTTYADEHDRPVYDTSTDSDDTQVPLTTVNRRELPQSCLSNKLSKLTLATFDEDGRCIGQMGSWSFSY
ncbi:putative FERM domain-containing protein FRMD8P1 [Schistocerca americana]|uniref:putative FERM domain-containing protein FRMD8P1 n=1 Tax=Schistocerca americana TaxID=7009 RepID=UPI001F4F814B|nr:putative FERM domain-containing protein FRMD8P1 [Schistocerca americana]XP_046980849.1 putative FERM domain-containing protein FRMD8P1 [Schistocerca americana]XP_046980857.1 putative FERM domain-containing protein FRMD8P1 [Schistocerca americana]XP_046980864.1 putative FERM domain-containing protein FRMD8P1 [Schistocerca americana]XP_046980871.1 putative FERM domain-containing protein FRMD8P1 [Schistocerca americana]XP_046980880.1 putative FERM domain-containing protein FRMD8P1 [Schistocerc